MSRTSRQQGVETRKAGRRGWVHSPRPSTLTLVLLCSLLTAGPAPGHTSPVAMANAKGASASVTGQVETGVPDRLPLHDPFLLHRDGTGWTTPGQTRVVTSSDSSPAAVQPVDISTLASDGIPVVALRAYRHAADLANHLTSGCAVPWTLLAAIGRVESDHGRFAGSVLLASGLSTPRIIGIPLNGVGTGFVRDTDHGVLDGDPVFDHAIGPMQFIPSTWALYATDGNRDGIADPFNIYDAAAAAGNYLCKAGKDLGTRAGRVRAILAYNHSDSYVADVLALEATYAGTPITTGPSPVSPIVSAPLPPVNPGVPPAIRPTVRRPAAPSRTPSGATPTPAPTPTDTTPAPTPTSACAPLTPPPTSACATLTPPLTDAPNGSLTNAQKITLAAIAERWQMADDLYLAFADRYGASVFTWMSTDETRQLTDLRDVLKLYAVTDPTGGQPVGTFASASTRQLYDTLLAQGATDVDAAQMAARRVEATGITDLTTAATDLTAPNVTQLYAKLLAASRVHLGAVGG